MDNINDPDHQNKREFSRIDVHVPLGVRLVPPEQRRLICSRREDKISTGAKLPLDVAEPQLAEWLRLLNAKLDTILSLLAKNQAASELPPLRTETLSGGGLSFTAPEEYNLGDLLELKIIFNFSLSGTFYLYGEVVKKDKSGDGYLTAVNFLALDEDIQDEIIKFVFEKERELLRHKRKE